MQELKHMVTLKGIVLLVCTVMVAGMCGKDSKPVTLVTCDCLTCVMAKTARAVRANHTQAYMTFYSLHGAEIVFIVVYFFVLVNYLSLLGGIQADLAT